MYLKEIDTTQNEDVIRGVPDLLGEDITIPNKFGIPNRPYRNSSRRSQIPSEKAEFLPGLAFLCRAEDHPRLQPDPAYLCQSIDRIGD